MTHAHDANAILARPLNTRKGKELVEKLSEIHEHLEERGHKPNHQFLDNETSQEMKSYLKGKDVAFQFAPPHDHQKKMQESVLLEYLRTTSSQCSMCSIKNFRCLFGAVF